MIKMTCGYCGKKYNINENSKLTANCSLCGCKSMRFNKNVTLHCDTCGAHYEVKRTEVENLSHKSRCYSRVFFISTGDGDESIS